MGIVYEAEQESLGRHVALKVLPAEAASDITCLKRFCREAPSAARLRHTNIVPVHAAGCHGRLHARAASGTAGRADAKPGRSFTHGPISRGRLRRRSTGGRTASRV